MNTDTIFHSLPSAEVTCERLNSPFRVRACEEVLTAQRIVMAHCDALSLCDERLGVELRAGKMLGVLVVRNESGEVGFLAGFSGSLAGRGDLEGFVPPIFGDLCSVEFFEAQAQIEALTAQIEQLVGSDEFAAAKASYQSLLSGIEQQRARLAAEYAKGRQRRAAERLAGERARSEIDRDSQHQKGEIRRQEQIFRSQLEESQSLVEALCDRVEELKARRRSASNELQRLMFESYQVVNGRGESRSLYDIFDEVSGHLPPSGAGECAAPKMLYYALTQGYEPLSIGEFWYGESTQGEVRHHSYFYAACKSRCEPILRFMLEGVEVEPQPVKRSLRSELRVVFEDEHLVLFDKPSGMLSVDGKSSAESVAGIVRELYPDATGAMMVHRLDEDTSGLLLVAKSAQVHRGLQRQFAERTLTKRYVAVVDGVVAQDRGEITLPLMPNIEDRPRQMVSHKYGKSSHTSYEVVERYDNGTTRLRLTPHTGRTHQLRVHCAATQALSSPIVGDRLYGRGEGRLRLHAEQITFRHPITKEELYFCSPALF